MRRVLFVLAAPVVPLVASACATAAAPAAGAALPPEKVTIIGADDFRMNPANAQVRD